MKGLRVRPAVLNVGIIALTVGFVAMALVVGRAEAQPAMTLDVGDVVTETFTAPDYIQLDDEEATELARQQARDAVPVALRIDNTVRTNVLSRINDFFLEVRAAPLGPAAVANLSASGGNPQEVGEEGEENVFTIAFTFEVQNLTTSSSGYDLVVEDLFGEAVTVTAAEFSQDRNSDGALDATAVPLDPEADSWVLAGGDPEDPADDLAIPARSTDTYVVTVTFSVDPAAVTEAITSCADRPEGQDRGALSQRALLTSKAETFEEVSCRNIPAVTVIEPPVDEEGEEGEGDQGEEGESTTTTTEPPTTTTTEAPTETDAPTTTIPVEDQEEAIEREFLAFSEAIPAFVRLYADHVATVAGGGEPFFDDIEDRVRGLAEDILDEGIQVGELDARKQQILEEPPELFVAGLLPDQSADLDRAAAVIVANSLQANELVDEAAWEEAQQIAAEAVTVIPRTYLPGQPIVSAGEVVDAVALQAIRELGLLEPEPGTSRIAAAVLGGLAVLLAALFLWRIAPARWSQPKHMGLLGVLLFLAAVVSRIPEILAVENPELAYVIPAAMLGYASAIMYDPRTALLTAVPMAMFAAISTQDPAITVFAAAATVAPIAFVSAVSTRRQLRLAVILSAVVLIPIAATVAWFFDGRSAMVTAAAAAFAGGLIGGFLGQGLVSFLENAFGLTTTVTLLDLTDRNHPALRLIEEKAPGTFNHSILVGNLAGKAARAIGADPLLAQAAAFYHDLGKTENPAYFIENQFSVSNPHDDLDPAVSADIIRRHVADGLELARRFRIPADVAAGIEQHHGTGLMRYFYHKAMEVDPSVDPKAFRHTGTKPQRQEMAILMISDAVEGAARAMAQHEDPTAESLSKLVDSIVGEKLDDGQLDESALTFGDLTRVKQALVQALIGYYHTRIPYPGFPGPQVEAQ